MGNSNSISIVIPTFNEQTNIERCLNSIMKQKFKGNIEVFIVDGESSDKTLEIAKRFKVKILENPKKWAEYGKIIGLRESKADYFMIMDADMELCGEDWFNKMIAPLAEDEKIVASFTKYVAYPDDSFLNRYITIDSIQRDPLFRFLTPDPKQVIKETRKKYYVCEYQKEKIVPAGFCIYRRKQLLNLELDKRHKYMELDNLAIFVKAGFNKFAYVPSAGIHHPFLKDLKTLVKKRIRNLTEQFFNQPDKREFTWIDFSSSKDKLKILIWIIYANSLIFPAIVGIWRAIRFKKIEAIYEPVFVWITTNIIILIFLFNREGRKLIFSK